MANYLGARCVSRRTEFIPFSTRERPRLLAVVLNGMNSVLRDIPLQWVNFLFRRQADNIDPVGPRSLPRRTPKVDHAAEEQYPECRSFLCSVCAHDPELGVSAAVAATTAAAVCSAFPG